MSPLSLTSRADVLSATAGHPYARFVLAASAAAHGVADERAVIWVCGSHFGLLGHALGPFEAVVGLLATAGDLVSGARWINLPRHAAGDSPAGFVHHESWDLRWSVTPPPRQPAEARVIELTDADAGEVHALLDAAMPETPVRPGADLVRAFYGIRDGGRLVACAADRSSPVAPDPATTVGVLGAVAVHPDHRRRGLGAAITAGLTRRLARVHALVMLGQAADNDAATHLYPRLGYTGVQHLTSVRCA